MMGSPTASPLQGSSPVAYQSPAPSIGVLPYQDMGSMMSQMMPMMMMLMMFALIIPMFKGISGESSK